MKTTITSILLASVVALNVSAAEEKKASALDISATSTIAFESEYVFRGIKQYNSAIQPSLDISKPVYEGDAYIGYWGSYGTGNSDTSSYAESDAYLGYRQSLNDMWSMDVGYTRYMYDIDGTDDQNEIYVGFSADYLDLNPSLYAYWNFDIEGFVLESSIGRSIDTSSYVANTSLDLGAHLGINNVSDANVNLAGKPEDAYVYAGLTSDVVYTINDTASAKIGVRYDRNNNDSGVVSVKPQEDLFWWGVSTSFGF